MYEHEIFQGNLALAKFAAMRQEQAKQSQHCHPLGTKIECAGNDKTRFQWSDDQNKTEQRQRIFNPDSACPNQAHNDEQIDSENDKHSMFTACLESASVFFFTNQSYCSFAQCFNPRDQVKTSYHLVQARDRNRKPRGV